MRQKIRRLRLEVVVRQIQQTTTSNELPSVEEEKQLRALVEAKTPLSVIAKKLGVSEESVRAKVRRLGLVVEEEQRKKYVFFF